MKKITERSITKTYKVTPEYTTEHLKAIAVLSTPSLVLLTERTAAVLVAPFLEDGEGTVGTAVELQHEGAVKKGGFVTIHVELQTVDGNRLDFNFTAVSGEKTIGRGSHSRFVVDISRFAERIASEE